jgi:3-phosphoshikimate 1-carboxyvinyltransferase
MEMARALGAEVTTEHDMITIEAGTGPEGPVSLNCGESGLALRMFAPVAAALSDSVILNGEGSLLRRPVTMITEALGQLGVNVTTREGLLPVQLSGRLRSGRAVIDGSTGSQLLTGLLMALPLTENESRIDVANLTSRPYVSLTVSLLAGFGITVFNDGFRSFLIPGGQSYSAREYTVEGDWSGAAIMLVAGAIGGSVTVRNLDHNSGQADRSVLRALEDAGASITVRPGIIGSAVSPLCAFSYDATDSPDLFPALAALAAYCNGVSRISGVGRLRHKESDRAEAIADVLQAMRIDVRISGDEMIITGGRVHGAVVSSHNDHRIAMMAAVMAAGAAGTITITGAEAVAKSYPDFYDDIARLGGIIS